MHYSKKAEHIYAVISKLNNELANCNRELEQKNYELNCVNKKFSQMLNTDYLTGLFSRKFIQDKLNYFINYDQESLKSYIVKLDKFGNFILAFKINFDFNKNLKQKKKI